VLKLGTGGHSRGWLIPPSAVVGGRRGTKNSEFPRVGLTPPPGCGGDCSGEGRGCPRDGQGTGTRRGRCTSSSRGLREISTKPVPRSKPPDSFRGRLRTTAGWSARRPQAPWDATPILGGACGGTRRVTIALGHPTVADGRAELRRNDGLRRLLGGDTEAQVPQIWNRSRFVQRLGPPRHRAELRHGVDFLIRHPGRAMPTLGQHPSGDSTTLNTRPDRGGPTQQQQPLELVPDQERLPVAAGGRPSSRADGGQVQRFCSGSGPWDFWGSMGHRGGIMAGQIDVIPRTVTGMESPGEIGEPLPTSGPGSVC